MEERTQRHNNMTENPKKSKELAKEITSWLENLEGTSLNELREITSALGYDVSAIERDFLTLLNEKLHKNINANLLSNSQVNTQIGEEKEQFKIPITGLITEGRKRGLSNVKLANACNLSITLISKLDRRLITFSSVPVVVIKDIAAVLHQSTEQILVYLQGKPLAASGANYKANASPIMPSQQDFFEAVRADLSISEERRQRLLGLETGRK